MPARRGGTPPRVARRRERPRGTASRSRSVSSVARELRGHLHQQRSELLPQRLHGLRERLQQLAHPPQLRIVRDRARDLGREAEMRRRVTRPRAGDGGLGRVVEGGVQLHRVEDLGVERQPVLLLGAGRVEDALPVIVRPALRPDAYGGAHAGVPVGGVAAGARARGLPGATGEAADRAAGPRVRRKNSRTRLSYSARCTCHAWLCPASATIHDSVPGPVLRSISRAWSRLNRSSLPAWMSRSGRGLQARNAGSASSAAGIVPGEQARHESRAAESPARRARAPRSGTRRRSRAAPLAKGESSASAVTSGRSAASHDRRAPAQRFGEDPQRLAAELEAGGAPSRASPGCPPAPSSRASWACGSGRREAREVRGEQRPAVAAQELRVAPHVMVVAGVAVKQHHDARPRAAQQPALAGGRPRPPGCVRVRRRDRGRPRLPGPSGRTG